MPSPAFDAAIAKSHEPDRYAAALLATRETERHDLVALATFAAELRRIPEAVKEPMMGEIRLQWWRDGLSQAEQSETHPVLAAVHAVQKRHALPIPLLLAMTEARSFDLYPDAMPDEATFDAYLMKTEGVAFDLAARVLGQSKPPQALITSASRAYGIARHLAVLPSALSRGRIPLPAPRLGSIDTDMLLRGSWSPELAQLRDSLVADAHRSYEAAQQHVADLPGYARLAFLPLALIPAQLAAIIKAGPTWLTQPPEMTPFGRYWRLWRSHRRGVI